MIAVGRMNKVQGSVREQGMFVEREVDVGEIWSAVQAVISRSSVELE